MFDIVIPIWKMKTKYLKTCLESVLAQTHQEYKCYIIDGTPTDWEEYDAQMRMLKPILKDRRFEYHRHRNLEKPFVSEAMNQGAELGSNPYIQFIGGDDFFYSHHFKTMKENIECEPTPEEVGVYFCMVQMNKKRIIDLGESKLGQVRTYIMNHYLIHPFLQKDLLKYFHSATPILMNGAVFNREIFQEIGGFQEDMVYSEDTDLVMKILLKDYHIRWFPYIGAYLRVGKHQSTVEGEVPYDREREFKRCDELYIKRYSEYLLGNRSIESANEQLTEVMGEMQPKGLVESIWGVAQGGYKYLSSKLVEDKEAFFILKTEEEERLFTEGDIVL